jgi:hypothetical protein
VVFCTLIPATQESINRRIEPEAYRLKMGDLT